MIKRIKIKLGDESGNSVIESTFIVTTTVFIIFFIMLFGFVRYQFSLIQSIANETATSIARTYSYCQNDLSFSIFPSKVGKDPVTGYIEPDNLSDQGLIGSAYYIGTGSGATLSMSDANKNLPYASGKNELKAREGLAEIENLVANRSFMVAQKYKYEVTIKHSELALFQNEVCVKIKESYYIPLAKVLGAPNGELEQTVVGKAMCTDFMGAYSYYNTINKAVGAASDNPIVNTLKNCVSALSNITGGAGTILTAIFGGSES